MVLIDRKHAIQFALLFIIFTLGVVIIFTTPDFMLKRITVVLLALLYPIWGIWHSYEHGWINRSITWEYLLLGLLVLVAFLGILG
jgi:hypothetical protein